MKTNPFTLKTEWFPLLLLIVTVGMAMFLSRYLPEQVPIHWNINGQIDGYSGRIFGAWFMPCLMIALYLVFLILPSAFPARDNQAHLHKAFYPIKNLILFFLFLIYCGSSFASLNSNFDFGQYIFGAVGILLVCVGFFLKDIPQNFVMGVRTPWTLQSKTVWDKSNALMRNLLMVVGCVIALLTFLTNTDLRMFLLLVSIACLVVIPILYSYLAFVKEKAR